MRVPRHVDRSARRRSAAHPRAVPRAGRVRSRGRARRGPGGRPDAGRRPRRPHARPFVTLDPGRLDGPRPGVRVGDGRRRHRAALRDRRRRLLRRRPGDALDTEAWAAASRSTCPTSGPGCTRLRCPRAPPACCRTVRRPAVVFTVRVDGRRRGDASTASSGPIVRSRAKLAYETVRPADLPPELGELARRIVAAEDAPRRPAGRVPRAGARRWSTGAGRCASIRACRARTTTPAMSLATNLAVADAMLAAGTGLFRVMAEPTAGAVRRLRRTPPRRSASPGRRSSRWPTSNGRCRPHDPQAAAFLIAVRRAGGGASYAAVRARRDAVARRRWPPPTPTPPRRCAASPTATSSRRRWRSPTAGRSRTTSQAAFAALARRRWRRRAAGQRRRPRP